MKKLPLVIEKDPEKIDLIQIFNGWNVGDWVWCLHCERVYKVGEFRLDKRDDTQLCPYDDCNGSPLDANHWMHDFEPERNKIYPMYG